MSGFQCFKFGYNHQVAVVCYLVILLLLSGNLMISPASSSASNKLSEIGFPQNKDAGKPHVLAASYYSVKDDLESTLKLNNKGSRPLDVQLTLYSLAGEQFHAPLISVEGTSFRVIDLRDLVVQAGTAFQEGSLHLFYRGDDLMLGAQVQLIDAEQSFVFDEQLVEPAVMFASSSLEGVWWLPSRDCEMRLVLSNTTDLPLTVSVTVDGTAPKQKEPAILALQPHETRTLDVQRDILEHQGGRAFEAGAISIRHTGPKGALLARGMIQDSFRGYSSVVEFSDPAKAKSSELHGAGLRLSTATGEPLEPIIVVRNMANAPTVITGRIPYATSDGTFAELSLPDVRLRAGETKVVKVPADFDRGVVAAGLEFSHSSAPGSVMISALSMDSSGNHVFRIPLLDPAAQQSSTGGYPWLIEQDSSTVVYVKNVTDQPQQYVMELSYPGGAYTLGLRTVEAGQTAAVDIRQLRDGQVADEHGQVIPKEARSGQVHWSLRGPEELVLIGRAEQADLARGLSSSYACQNCCGDSFYQGSCLPNPVIGIPGDTNQFRAQEQDKDCFGNLRTPFTVSPSSWSSDNTAVATINASGLATAQGGGSANITARWTAYTRHLSGYPAVCVTNTITPGASALCTVQVPTFVQVVSDPGCYRQFCYERGWPGNTHYAYVRSIHYRVLDANKNPINRAGMTIREYIAVTSNPCQTNPPAPGLWTTDSTGTTTQPDEIVNCSQTCHYGGNCTNTWEQWFVINDSLGVRIVSKDGTITGSKNAVSLSCTSCPTVTIVP